MALDDGSRVAKKIAEVLKNQQNLGSEQVWQKIMSEIYKDIKENAVVSTKVAPGTFTTPNGSVTGQGEGSGTIS